MTKERSIVIILAGVLLGILILCFFSVNASAGEPCFSKKTDAAESEFKTSVKDVLGEYGIRTAGVTMTKVSYDGVNITYKVQIHISSYKSFSETEKDKLLKDLQGLNIEVDNSEVKFSFS